MALAYARAIHGRDAGVTSPVFKKRDDEEPLSRLKGVAGSFVPDLRFAGLAEGIVALAGAGACGFLLSE